MRHLIFFMPILLLSFFAFSQKKNGKTNVEKSDNILQTNMQKNVETLSLSRLKNDSSAANYIASIYKRIGLQPFTDSIFLQPYTLDLGKEIKPVTVLKVNGIIYETGVDYWPFSFCPNSFFAGTAIWGTMESSEPFLYDLKPEIEKNKTIRTPDLLKLIKDKTREFATKKVSAIIFHNSLEINDSLNFSANDTTALTTIPVVYFTKSGIKRLRNESTIANAIEAKIVLGEKIVNGTNTLAYLNNGAASTVIIATSINNEIGTATIFELAKLLKETCQPIKKNAIELNAANYTNTNYLFVNFNGNDIENLGSIYFLEHLPFGVEKINYALNVGITGETSDTANFLLVSETASSLSWKNILQNTNQSFISKPDSSLVKLNAVPFYKKNIPNLYLFNAMVGNQQKNKAITINKNDINTINYIMQLISSANKYGKLSFNKNDN